jgi:LytS/YehU family sensor histidine kinase
MSPPREDQPKPPSRFLITLLFLVVAFIIATATELFLFAQRKQHELSFQKNEMLQTELKLLKSQINPHFLFNALNNIYALSVTNSEKTQSSISHLSTMLRYVLYDCDRPLVSVSKEIECLKNYIELFSLKSSREFNISTHFTVEDESIKIAPMVLIPFVENAFKHSHKDLLEDAFVDIMIKAEMNTIDINIKNSIPNREMTTDAVGGIGLDNVKRRLQMLYLNAHNLNIKASENTFEISLHLKIDEHA